MADQTSIDQVIANLPSWRVDVANWDDNKIGLVLDQKSGNVNRTVRQFWVQRVSDTAALTDVADAGANRPLSQTYQHAREMLDYWDRITGEGRQASKIVKIKQRYEKNGYPLGLSQNSEGGVYVRAD